MIGALSRLLLRFPFSKQTAVILNKEVYVTEGNVVDEELEEEHAGGNLEGDRSESGRIELDILEI